MAAKILGKLQKNTFSDKFLYKARKARFVLKMGLFQFKVGWFKIKARTNLGPQNYMYLSAPGQPCVVSFSNTALGNPSGKSLQITVTTLEG